MFQSLKPPPLACASLTAYSATPCQRLRQTILYTPSAAPQAKLSPSCLPASSLPLRHQGGEARWVEEMQSREKAQGLLLLRWWPGAEAMEAAVKVISDLLGHGVGEQLEKYSCIACTEGRCASWS